MKQSNNETIAVSRPPVITVLGHVDHGKTTLLDTIRKTNVAEGEAGGITQHTGAYQATVEHDGEERLLTFIDTPGHAAFHQMRSRGASVADIAVLVVAADDGVQPQTKEAIEHIRDADIPFIVAVNKIDKDNANPSQAKAELAEIDVTVESFGGSIPDVEISALNNKNIDELLEVLILTADLQELTADTAVSAEGVVVEAELDTRRGALATLLIRNGTLHQGEDVATPSTDGTVRSMENFQGEVITFASPSTPVRILGLSDVPIVGEPFRAIANEHERRQWQESSVSPQKKQRTAVAERATALPVILKADATGTLEALAEMIETISGERHSAMIIHRGVGSVTDNDIAMAEAANGVVVAFRVDVKQRAEHRADESDIAILRHDVIYEIVEMTKRALEATLDTQTVREELGTLKVLMVFRDDPKRMIVGGRVMNGMIRKHADFDIERNDETVGEGVIQELHRNKKPADEVSKGDECGLRVQSTIRIHEDDILRVYHTVKKKERLATD